MDPEAHKDRRQDIPNEPDTTSRPPHETAGVWIGVLFLLLAVPITAWGSLLEPGRQWFWLFVPPLVAGALAAVPIWWTSRAANAGWAPTWSVPLFLVLSPLMAVPVYLLYHLPAFGAWVLLGISEGLNLSVFRDYAGIWWLFLVGTAVLWLVPGLKRFAVRLVSWVLPGVLEGRSSALGSYFAVMMSWFVLPALFLRSTRTWARAHWRQAVGNLVVFVAVAAWSGETDAIIYEVLLSPAIFAAVLIGVVPVLYVLQFVFRPSTSFRVRALWLFGLLELPIAILPFYVGVRVTNEVNVALEQGSQLIEAGRVEEGTAVLDRAFERAMEYDLRWQAEEVARQLGGTLIARKQFERASEILERALSAEDLDDLFSTYHRRGQRYEDLADHRRLVLDLMILRMYALAGTGRLQEAIETGQEALNRATSAKLSRQAASIWRTAAKIHEARGEDIYAFQALESARALLVKAGGSEEEVRRLEEDLRNLGGGAEGPSLVTKESIDRAKQMQSLSEAADLAGAIQVGIEELRRAQQSRRAGEFTWFGVQIASLYRRANSNLDALNVLLTTRSVLKQWGRPAEKYLAPLDREVSAMRDALGAEAFERLEAEVRERNPGLLHAPGPRDPEGR